MTSQTLGAIKVQVGQQQGTTVRSISYGTRTLKSSTDLSMTGAQDGDSVIYDANTNSFIVAPVTVSSGEITDIQGGTF